MNKPELLKWLMEEQQKWELILAAIGEVRISNRVLNGTWSIRDIIAHLSEWQRWLVVRFQAAANGQPEPPPPWPANLTSKMDINNWIYESNRNRSARQVLADAQSVHEQLLEIIQDLPKDCRMESIESKFHVIWVNNQRFAVGEFFHHFYDDHAADVQAWLENAGWTERLGNASAVRMKPDSRLLGKILRNCSGSYDVQKSHPGFDAEIQRLAAQADIRFDKKEEPRTLSWFGLQDGMSDLEVGSGPGFITEQLLESVPNGSITCLEINPALLAQAEDYLQDKASQRVRFIEGSVMDIQLEANQFDCAYARFVSAFARIPSVRQKRSGEFSNPAAS